MTTSDGFRWTDESWGPALRSSALLDIADHFFTTRQLWLRGASEDADWAAAAATIGVPVGRLQRLRQVHGCHAVVFPKGDDPARRVGSRTATVAAADAGAGDGPRPEADILASDDPSLALAIQVADCVPLLMADRRSGAVAGVHAGWRGTAAGAAGAAVDVMTSAFGTRPADLVVAIGPSIGRCCYEVGPELADAFERGHGRVAQRWFSRDGSGRLVLDLWTANREQLIAAGVPAGQVHASGICTSSHPEWFASYRRDGPGTGRIAAVIRARA